MNIATPLLRFPELPTEIVIHILSFACNTSHHTALNISLVSTWARQLVLPCVFSTVVRRAGNTGGYAHLLPPGTCDVSKYVRHLWIETIDMMSSPGELSIFNLCTNIEDVALTAGSLRLLYNSTLFGKRKGKGIHTVGAASRIRSVTLTKHTFRYDWHFLVDLHSTSDTHASLLGNITHLRLTDMEKSPYIPLEYLPNLTHLALPYLQLRANNRGDVLRIPDIVTPSKLEMIVLAVDEFEWLMKPWRHGAHAREDSPRELFKSLRNHARGRDKRIHAVLSPRFGQDICGEWAAAVRGNEDSVWELAEKMSGREEYGDELPSAFPRVST
ncbi:hypothetical protein BC835DRAFT_1265994 [Cytidiella melzeri]|nr:hypothetical protein BC835DRAFT_1265994 [Cytidiella melzeri]